MLSLALAPLFMGASVSLSAAEGFELLSDAEFSGQIRPRYEFAQIVSNGVDAGNAATMRTTLGMGGKLLDSKVLNGYFELTSVNNFGYDKYSTAAGGMYDVVEDPNQARVGQAYVDYSKGSTLFRAGRQIINMDNERFLGSHDWRQMPQSFDAITVIDKHLEYTTLTAAYVAKVNGVSSSMETGSAVFNAAVQTSDDAVFNVYAYMLASIHDTYGTSLSGKGGPDEMKYSYRLEYAMQSDPSLEYRQSGVKADSNYMNFDLALNADGVIFGAGYEAFGGTDGTDGKSAFSAPLGSHHAFNGWADVFTDKPAGGLQDTSVRVGYQSKNLGKLMGVYHIFTSEQAMATATGTSKDLGSEIDAVYVKQFENTPGISISGKAAFYSKSEITGYTNDVTKYWVQLDYQFVTK